MEEQAIYAIFIDHSDSVRRNHHYWNVITNIVQGWRYRIKNYYFWDYRVRDITYQDVKDFQLRGFGECDSTVVAKKIQQLQLSHVILITGSEINGDNVQKTDAVLEQAAQKGFQLSSVICYIISSGKNPMSLSSTCPFTRYGDSTVYLKRKGEEMKLIASCKASNKKYVNSLDYINLNNFQFSVKNLENYIINLNMGRSGLHQVRYLLQELRKRLVYELSTMKTQEDYSKLMRESLEQKDTNTALEYAKKMTYEYMSFEYSMEIQSKINHLISLCGDLRNQFDVNAIKSNKIINAVEAKQAEIDKEISIQELTMNAIECPIIMDEDVPQILIDQGQPVLFGFDKKIVDDIAVCPLRILNYPEVKAKFKARLSTFTGTKLNGKIYKNPYTQNKLLGAIPLGKHKTHIDVGNYTIAQMVSGGKILGNLTLYYAVIWYLVNEGWIEYLKPIKENVAEHLIYRLRNTETTASMCGLGQFVATRVTMDVAIWYVVNSGYFNLPTNRDVFRYHIFNMEPMVKILKVLKYPLHLGVKEHFFRTRALLKMLFKLKKYNPNFQKGFHTIFKGFYQKGFFVDITNVSIDFWNREVCAMFIPVDGEADNNQRQKIRNIIPKCCKYLSNQEVYYLSTLLDASKSASDIPLDYNVVIPQLPKAQINWCYGLKQFENLKVKICPGSMRPYLKVNGKKWQVIAKETYEVEDIDQLFSGNRAFEMFVTKYKRYPISKDQLAIFFYNRFLFFSNRSTLPYLTQKWTEGFIEDYNFAGFHGKNRKTIQTIRTYFSIMNYEMREKLQLLE